MLCYVHGWWVSCLMVALPAGAFQGEGRLEASFGVTNGSVVSDERSREVISKHAVQLAGNNQFLSWKSSGKGNRLVMRFNCPDHPDGGGRRQELGVYINDRLAKRVQVTSRHAWLYGEGENPQNNRPGPGAHRFFDETWIDLPKEIHKGDWLSIRPLGSSMLAVDFVEIYRTPPPRRRPPNSLSVVDFGARPDDSLDDTNAIRRCVQHAKRRGKRVWLPAGEFRQRAPIRLDGVSLEGAGMWHTALVCKTAGAPASKFIGCAGFILTGNRSSVQHLRIEGSLTSRADSPTQRGFYITSASNFVVRNVWVEHVRTGFWISNSRKGLVERCWVRNTYSDGLNVNTGSQDIRVERNGFRNTGDDGIAVFSNRDNNAKRECRRILVKQNVVEMPWWANGIAVYGGTGIRAMQNRIGRTVAGAGILVSTGHDSFPGRRLLIQENVLSESGGRSWGRSWGAMSVYVPFRDIEVKLLRNRIDSPKSYAMRIWGTRRGGDLRLQLQGNRLNDLSSAYILVEPTAKGDLVVKSDDFARSIVNQSSRFKVQVAR